jgi:hypothetical protein
MSTRLPSDRVLRSRTKRARRGASATVLCHCMRCAALICYRRWAVMVCFHPNSVVSAARTRPRHASWDADAFNIAAWTIFISCVVACDGSQTRHVRLRMARADLAWIGAQLVAQHASCSLLRSWCCSYSAVQYAECTRTVPGFMTDHSIAGWSLRAKGKAKAHPNRNIEI